MPEFQWAESYGSRVQRRPRTLRAEFGDGYSQRAGDGIHPQLGVWSLVFSGVDEGVADAIEAFLDARAGVEAFDWNAPGTTALGRYVCPEWTRSYDRYNGSTITATFEEVAEP